MPSDTGSRHEKATLPGGIGRRLGLAETIATGVIAAAGEPVPALGTAGAAQAKMEATAARPTTHLMPG
jgi:hypothetical protein